LIGNITLDDTFAQDSEGLFRRLRSEAPVCQVEVVGGVLAWLVTRYHDAVALLTDPRLSKDQARAFAQYAADGVRPYSGPLQRHMLHVDPPEHTRLRRLVIQAFTPRAIARMQPVIEAIADELLDNVYRKAAGAGTVDLIADYAEPLPIRVLGELLGLPSEFSQPFKIAVRPMLSNATLEDMAISERQVVDILSELIELKTRRPGEDLLSAMIGASIDGSGLTQEELLAMCFLLIIGGYETTVNVIGNGMLALLDNPPQLNKVRADPTLLSKTVEEILRFDGPLNVATLRFTTAEIDVDGITIPPNQPVFISLLSANRDDARFPDAHKFDVERNTTGHLAFGHGIHRCLGAPLGRMEAITAIGRLIERFDHITLDRSAGLLYHNAWLVHGLRSLPVRLSPAPDAATH
jgi:cytochrome P450